MKFRIYRTAARAADPCIEGTVEFEGVYYIDVTTVEQLFSMVGKNTDKLRDEHYGWDNQNVVLTRHWQTDEPEIEIYDDWRE